MNIKEIRQTPVWQLYEQGRNYHRRAGIYTDTDRNYRMYNGNQWEGAKLGDAEPVQKNFIKPIVKYKLSVIHDNLYGIHYVPAAAREQPGAERLCRILNRWAAQVWEKDKLDHKGRRLSKDAAINDEGILYVDFDREKGMPVNEIVKKNDIYYGNENEEDLQAQPYILIRKRLPLNQALELAKAEGLRGAQLELIVPDKDTFDRSGEAAKEELRDMVTVVYKLYKKDGKVWFSSACRLVELAKDVNTGLTLYPIAHFNWEEREGSARGEGEVRYLIPNQIEVNRTEVRRVLTVKYQAYPQKIVDTSKVTNPQALNTVGGIIRTNGAPVEDVQKIVGVLPPAQMSPDVVKLQEDLIAVSRELAGAGDTATGAVNPESASGRAILAVQQAAQAPMTEQKESYKNFLEDVARIWLDYWVAYVAGQMLENVTQNVENRRNFLLDKGFAAPKAPLRKGSWHGEAVSEGSTTPPPPDGGTSPYTGEALAAREALGQRRLTAGEFQQAVRKMLPTVKIEVSPKGVYDRFAQEQTVENLLVQGFFSAQRVEELAAYASLLEEDSVAPRQKILQAVQYIRAQQLQIARIQAQAQQMMAGVRGMLGQSPAMAEGQMAQGSGENAQARRVRAAARKDRQERTLEPKQQELTAGEKT